ncbi:MAG: dimethyl sulfoxide reductase anchor subunit [Alphaproteobacteria bacterium]|nr:dimethyl sulfoxide reductase anchor subunit [Alphaproteobacteria bacterium]
MHPAYSVIFFTTASGAGYGLLVWLAMASALRGFPADWALGLIGLGLALALITGGLLSSTAHLGRPERAWRAFSQWRSSWLSREGVLAVATYIPAAILGISWVFYETTQGAVVFASVLASVLAVATVYATGMIYASLPTIRAWNQPLTVPVYVTLALATGGVLFVFVLSLFTPLPTWAIVLPLAAVIAAYFTKRFYWEAVDESPRSLRPENATGLGHLGKVRHLEPPHAQANYVMREMGFKVARKHADKLRRLSAYLMFLVPSVCLLLLLVVSTYTAPLFALVAVIAMGVGVVIERWLFFAEAEHVSMLFYGAEAA